MAAPVDFTGYLHRNGTWPETAEKPGSKWESHDILFVTEQWMDTVYGEVIDVQKVLFSLFMTLLNSINKIYKIFRTISHFSYTSRGTVTVCYCKPSS